MFSGIAPSEPLAGDLGVLADSEVEVLNSKLHRERDYENVPDDGPFAETDSRIDDVTGRLAFHDLVSEGTKNPMAGQAPADVSDLAASDRGVRPTTTAPGLDFSVPGAAHHAR